MAPALQAHHPLLRPVELHTMKVYTPSLLLYTIKLHTLSHACLATDGFASADKGLFWVWLRS